MKFIQNVIRNLKIEITVIKLEFRIIIMNSFATNSGWHCSRSICLRNRSSKSSLVILSEDSLDCCLLISTISKDGSWVSSSESVELKPKSLNDSQDSLLLSQFSSSGNGHTPPSVSRLGIGLMTFESFG